MSKPLLVHNSESVHQNTNSHRPTEHINISPQRNLGSDGLMAFNDTSQDNMHTESSLGNNIPKKILMKKW
jgi:hypothetical protein